MAFLSLFGSEQGRQRAQPPLGAPSALGTDSRAEAAGPLANMRSEPVFAPRRATGWASMPANTRLPNVLGSQPQTFARGREVAALLLWTFAVFLALALASYAGDPQSVVTAEGQPPPLTGENWVGPVGASLARAFVLLVGVTAWIVPFEALLLGIPYVRGRKSTATPARLAGDLLMVVIGAALVQVGTPGTMAFGHHPAGGMIGELFGEVARSLFSTIGSFLVGFALIGLILIGRATFSFIALLRWIARLGSVSAEKTAGGARSVAGAWAKARELEREKEAHRKRANEPLIAGTPSGAATILVPDLDPADEEPIRDSDPEVPIAPAAHARIVSEPFPEESPLVIVEDAKKKTRRRKADDVVVPSATAVGFAPTVKASVKAKARAALPEPKLTNDDDEEAEAVAQAVTRDEDAPVEESPVEAIEVVTPDEKPKAGARKPAASAGITIVDTSAALEKTAPAKAEIKAKPEKTGAKPSKVFQLPPIDMLVAGKLEIGPLFDEEKLRRNADLLVKTLADYKITGKVEEILPGPVVTTYEVSPIAGTKVSKVAALADDLALALAKKVRIVAPIPGKNRIGFELPNERRVPVILRDLVDDRRFQTLDVPLPVVLGRDIVGNPVYADLASMPHAIVAGATGAGKSVGLNVMLTSLLYRRTPEELRMLMIDPKVVELAPSTGSRTCSCRSSPT